MSTFRNKAEIQEKTRLLEDGELEEEYMNMKLADLVKDNEFMNKSVADLCKDLLQKVSDEANDAMKKKVEAVTKAVDKLGTTDTVLDKMMEQDTDVEATITDHMTHYVLNKSPTKTKEEVMRGVDDYRNEDNA